MRYSLWDYIYPFKLLGIFKCLNQGPPNCEQTCSLFARSHCSHRTVRTANSANKRNRANSANSSNCSNSPNSEQCEQFTLYEQCEQRTVRTVHFFKIVEQGEQCEQVRTLFGGACPLDRPVSPLLTVQFHPLRSTSLCSLDRPFSDFRTAHFRRPPLWVFWTVQFDTWPSSFIRSDRQL